MQEPRPIKVILLGDGNFALLEPVTITIGDVTITVPVGYITDFASIPKPFRWWMEPTDTRVLRAALVHDWIYHTHRYPRVVADSFFEVLLREDGMPRWKGKVLSISVRTCGKRSYMSGPEKLRSRTPKLAEHIKKTHSIEFKPV